MTKVMETQGLFDKIFDKYFPIYSSTCGHKIMRVNSCHSGYYCKKCELIIPIVNVETKK